MTLTPPAAPESVRKEQSDILGARPRHPHTTRWSRVLPGFEISVDYRDYRQILPIPMTTDIGNR